MIRLEPSPTPSGAVLRRLIVDSLPSVFGDCELIHPRLPCIGAPLLILDAERRPVLIGFDPADAGRALLSALSAWDDVRRHPEWVMRLHPALTSDAIARELGIAVFARTPPPGTDCLMPGGIRPSVFVFRTLRANGEMALLVEPHHPAPVAVRDTFNELITAAKIVSNAVSREEATLPGVEREGTLALGTPLTEEEEALYAGLDTH